MHRHERHGLRRCMPSRLHSSQKDEPEFEPAEQLYIDPVECIDCGACVPVCPVTAIFVLDELPEKWKDFTEKNANYYQKQVSRKKSFDQQIRHAPHAALFIAGC